MIDGVSAALRLRPASLIWVFHDVSDGRWFQRCIDAITSSRAVVGLADLAREPSRRGACAITFDDGWRSVWSVAHPVLSARGIPYTVFVCTDMLVGGPVPWFVRALRLIERCGLGPVSSQWNIPTGRMERRHDVLGALKEIPLAALLDGLEELERRYEVAPTAAEELFMTAAEVTTLGQTGVTIGSHTHRHPILSRLRGEEQRREIVESARIIETLTGRRPTEFAYPNGRPHDFDDRTIGTLRESGIDVAVTSTQRYLQRGEDMLRVPRIGLDNGESSFRTMAKHVAPSLFGRRR
jgi:peptidoglycan/xylan/chitin deacetylase (PgdA/CDA1 family)